MRWARWGMPRVMVGDGGRDNGGTALSRHRGPTDGGIQWGALRFQRSVVLSAACQWPQVFLGVFSGRWCPVACT